jgi:hypothetical protein
MQRKLLPLSHHNSATLAKVVESNATLPLATLNSFLSEIMYNVNISNVNDLQAILNKLGNGVYNELIHWLENVLKFTPDNWSVECHNKHKELLLSLNKDKMKEMYRYVWFRKVDLQVLERSEIWQEDLYDCRVRAVREAHVHEQNDMYMVVESCCTCFKAILPLSNSEKMHIAYTTPCECVILRNGLPRERASMDGFSRIDFGRISIKRAPWYTSASKYTDRSYHFHIENVDVWFESEKKDILQAYLEYSTCTQF